jgi:hypothetical protein
MNALPALHLGALTQAGPSPSFRYGPVRRSPNGHRTSLSAATRIDELTYRWSGSCGSPTPAALLLLLEGALLDGDGSTAW